MELRSISMAMKGVEGYEATFQLTLQLFIAFTNLDRKPSVIQTLTILFSFLSVTTSFIEAKFSLDPAAAVLTKVKMIPFAMSFNIFTWLSTSLIITVIGWNYIIFFVTWTMIVFTIRVSIQYFGMPKICLNHISGYLQKWKLELTIKEISLNFGNYITISTTLIIIVILANWYPDIYIWNLWGDSYELSDLVIMRKKFFNTSSAVCLSSGVIYIISFILDLISMPKMIFEDSSLCKI